jgi:hypothetical protein
MARNRGVDPERTLDPGEIEGVAGLGGKLFEVLELGPAVPLTEGVDVVNVAEDDRCLRGKVGWRKAP